ncbi:tripartite tricarboxylate transporter TctB family protein [Pseudooceanicola spongiae]|jgi:putative tricarboxylic transport membrane protein|uniref:Tripartite tricarboxylate transporter TctB family protein n=1 Tax=Pseudooceanicola spongiae TaxID=2613965 RepID=A0A7L9WJY4_9RHOB|nr:tripartite tricarboxylate transporter TctB family protein [Pseudooceanicola spongiae]QOL80144.1 tripartite tricarboxylate transporter TctB family protein [Pseudooceanicola spongiae]
MIDRLVGLMILVISVTVFLVARGYEAGFGDPLGPAVFPQMVAALAAILSLGMIFRPDPNPDFRMDRARLKQLATLAVLIGYVLLLEPLGFPVSTTLATALLAALFGARAMRALATGLGTGVGLYLLFNNVLGLPLPLAPAFIG